MREACHRLTYDPFTYQPVHDPNDKLEKFNAYLAAVSPLDMAVLPFNKDVQPVFTVAEQKNAIFMWRTTWQKTTRP